MKKLTAMQLFGITAIPFLLSGALFFQIDGDKSDWIYGVLGGLSTAITIYLGYNVYKKVNG